MSSSTFGEYYQALGFNEYPFSLYTSEHEQKVNGDLFVSTSMYGPIIEGFKNKRTMIISGDRGTGKTSIILDFLKNVKPKSSIFVSVSDYSDLKIGYSSAEFYSFAIKQLSVRLFHQILIDKKSGNKLSKTDKIILSYFLYHFVPQATKSELNRQISDIQIGKTAKFINFIYGIIRGTLNIGVNACVKLVSDIISQSTGVTNSDAPWREYFPELSLNADNNFSDPDTSFETLKKLVEICKKIGYSNVLFIFDRVDEDQRFANAAEEISEFIEPIVTDNKFLLADEFQVVISIWVIPFKMLKDKVRTQKIYCPELQWSSSDLISALNRRIKVFSYEKISSINEIFDESSIEYLEKILSISNKNPRDLWHVMDKIMMKQFQSDPNSKKITIECIESGFHLFVSDFNFYEYYPRKSNAKASSMDVFAYIKHLLKLDDIEFTRNKLNQLAGTGSSTLNYVVGMESIGLIEKCGQQSGNILYKIRDPKVIYALQNKVDISRNG